MNAPTRDVHQALAVDCRALGGDGFRLTVELPRPLAAPLEGGHFFMVRTDGADFPYLSRPFSVHDVRGRQLDFIFKTVGRGTGCLSRVRAGDRLRLTGPLGRPFARPRAQETTVLVGGGVGLPPLFLYLRRRQQERRDEPALLLYGARVRAQLFELAAAESLGVPVRTATEDGSVGLHGRVDRLLAQTLDELRGGPARILCCGPDPMMAAVARLARERGVPCDVSLETFMACGFGVCNACAVPIDDGHGGVARFARACIDGPVLDATQVLWHGAAG